MGTTGVTTSTGAGAWATTGVGTGTGAGEAGVEPEGPPVAPPRRAKNIAVN